MVCCWWCVRVCVSVDDDGRTKKKHLVLKWWCISIFFFTFFFFKNCFCLVLGVEKSTGFQVITLVDQVKKKNSARISRKQFNFLFQTVPKFFPALEFFLLLPFLPLDDCYLMKMINSREFCFDEWFDSIRFCSIRSFDWSSFDSKIHFGTNHSIHLINRSNKNIIGKIF